MSQLLSEKPKFRNQLQQFQFQKTETKQNRHLFPFFRLL